MITVEVHNTDDGFAEQLSGTKHLILTSHKKIKKIPIDTILYIESNRRKVSIHTQSTSIDCYEKLNTLTELLQNNGFIRCHQSYLVQTDKIISFNSNNTIALQETASTIPVSRQHQKEIRHLLLSPVICGTLVCLKGAYKGSIIKIKPEQAIMIGRDGKQTDLVINLPLVSRIHCEIIYHAENSLYELTDFSSNGTYINGQTRILPYEPYLLKPGTTISFGDKETIYQLG